MPAEKLTYKAIYFGVLAALNILPEDPDNLDDDGNPKLINMPEDGDLSEENITPRDKAYHPLEIINNILNAETEVIVDFLSRPGGGRDAGDIASGGFVAMQTLATSGELLDSHVGSILNVEVQDVEGGPWIAGNPASLEAVSRFAGGVNPLGLKQNKFLYALNKDETRLYFTGHAARVRFADFSRPDVPQNLDDLIDLLKEHTLAPDEYGGAITDIAVGTTLPREGAMIQAGDAYRKQGYGRASISRQSAAVESPLAESQRRGSS